MQSGNRFVNEEGLYCDSCAEVKKKYMRLQRICVHIGKGIERLNKDETKRNEW